MSNPQENPNSVQSNTTTTNKTPAKKQKPAVESKSPAIKPAKPAGKKKVKNSENEPPAPAIKKDEETLRKFIDDKEFAEGAALLKMEDSFTLQSKADRIKIYKPKNDPKLAQYDNLTKIVFDTEIVFADAHEFCFDLRCIHSMLFEKLHEVYEFFTNSDMKIGQVVYSKTKSPNMFVSPREFLVARRSLPAFDGDYTKGFIIVTLSVDLDQYPVVSGVVRGFRFTVEQATPSPIRKNERGEPLTDWILIQSVDVKGLVPAWIVEKFIHKPPKALIQSLENKYRRFSERRRQEKEGINVSPLTTTNSTPLNESS